MAALPMRREGGLNVEPLPPAPQMQAAFWRLSSVFPVLYSASPPLTQELSVFLSVSPGGEVLTTQEPCSEQKVCL